MAALVDQRWAKLLNTGRPVDHLIQPVRLKLERAAKQRDLLIEMSSGWVARNPAKSHVEYLPFRHGYRLILDPFDEALPLDDLGLTFGEFAHNLRSALDNLAFSLARLRVDPPAQPKSIYFPISDDRAEFARNGNRYLQQLPEDVAILIEKIQPYNRDLPGEPKLSESDPLILLQRVNNMDKHRVPQVALFAPQKIAFTASVTFEDEHAAGLNTPPDATVWAGPLSPGVPLLEYRTKHPLTSVEGKFDVHADLSLVCDEITRPFADLVSYLHWYVCLVFDQFTPFFRPR